MCNICRHPARAVVDRDLLATPSIGAVAAAPSLPYQEAVKHKTGLLRGWNTPADSWHNCC